MGGTISQLNFDQLIGVMRSILGRDISVSEMCELLALIAQFQDNNED